jgi:cell division protein FtsL
MTRAIHGFGWALRRRETSDAVSLKNQFFVGALIILLIVSAFSVIYLKDLSRRLFIRYQNLQQVQQHDEVEWSKLLLEEGAWSTQSRVQNVATTQLNMIMPAMKNIVMIESRDATLPPE